MVLTEELPARVGRPSGIQGIVFGCEREGKGGDGRVEGGVGLSREAKERKVVRLRGEGSG